MKVCVISTPIFRLGRDTHNLTGCVGYSGLEELAWQRAKGLAARGHEVTLIAPDDTTCPGVTILPIGPERGVDEHMAYGGYPEQKDPQGNVLRPGYGGYWPHLLEVDVILDDTWNKWALALKEEGRLKAPVLCFCHAPVNTMFQELPPVEHIARPCFVCISQDQANHFQALYDRKCEVCYNGVDTSYYQPLNAPRSDRFLFLARFSSIKGPDIGLHACRAANAPLDLVGDTTITQEPAYLNACKALTDGDRWKFVGPATRGECVWWLSQAKALLHPNARFREPFGLAPVEAMLCGCPVVAWRRGAMKETVKEGETGWLVDSVEEFNALVARLHREGVPAEMRARCREWALQFSVEKMCDRLEELIDKAVKTGGW